MIWFVLWVCAIGMPAHEAVYDWDAVLLSEHVFMVDWCGLDSVRLDSDLDSPGWNNLVPDRHYAGGAWPDYKYAWCTIEAICAHEIGHLFGLSHTERVLSIMNPVVGVMIKPTKEDARWLRLTLTP